MFNANEGAQPELSTRRGFLKRLAIVGAAVSALSILSRRPFGGLSFGRSNEEGRSIPADIPGAGSIFQPRHDQRRQR